MFELSQTLKQKWLTADYATQRRILEIVRLNCTLDSATLCPTMRKPFDVLADGLISKNSRDGRRWTFPNDLQSDPLIHVALAQALVYEENDVRELADNCCCEGLDH